MRETIFQNQERRENIHLLQTLESITTRLRVKNKVFRISGELAYILREFNLADIKSDPSGENEIIVIREVLTQLSDDIDNLVQLYPGSEAYKENLADIAIEYRNIAALLGVRLSADGSTRFSSFTDPRDGRRYKTVKLINKTWMAANLNYDTGAGCWFYNNDPSMGSGYGRLYTWQAAKSACPPGWMLPTIREWSELIEDLEEGETYKAIVASERAKSDFAAQLGGSRYADGSFFDLDNRGFYWSSSEYNPQKVGYCLFSDRRQESGLHLYPKSWGLSCRCVKEF